MKTDGYFRPRTCEPGKLYFLKGTSGSGISEYRGVYFVAYRPHPGEVVIRDRNLSQIVHRSLIFARSDVDS